jgi:hypothetical protein
MLLTRGREVDVNQVDSAAPRSYKNLALDNRGSLHVLYIFHFV